MAFTSWQDLRTSILDDLADGSILTKSYAVGSRSRTFRDLSEVAEFLKFIDLQLGASGGTKTAFAAFRRPGGGL